MDFFLKATSKANIGDYQWRPLLLECAAQAKAFSPTFAQATCVRARASGKEWEAEIHADF